MLTLIALVIALLLLSPPWSYVIVAVALTIDIVELVLFVWWSRRRRLQGPPAVGVQALVGRRGVALVRLVPGPREATGQVRVEGEIWQARTDAVLEPGASVVVVGVDGLVLDVEPAQS